MDLSLAKTFLPEARELATRTNEAWFETADSDTALAEISITDPKTGEIVPIAHVLDACPFDDKQLMLKAPTLLRAALTLLDEAFRIIKSSQPPEQRQQRKREAEQRDGDYAAECAMKCGEQAFRRYLIDRHDLQDATDTTRVEVRVRSILNVRSRGELNTDVAARQRWFSLRADFENWKKGL